MRVLWKDGTLSLTPHTHSEMDALDSLYKFYKKFCENARSNKVVFGDYLIEKDPTPHPLCRGVKDSVSSADS